MERTLSLILMISLIAPLAIISVQAQNATLIDQTCKVTPNYNLCASTLNSDPHIREANDLKDLSIILVNHVNDLASRTRDHISKLLNDPSTDKTVKHLLNGCMTKYNSMINIWIKNTLYHLNKKDYLAARDEFESLPTDIGLCERSFEGPVKSPISADSKAVNDLSCVTFAIFLYKYTHPSWPPASSI